MNIHEAIKFLGKQITNPSCALPEELFLFISSITPLVNVDLLIKDEIRRTLLSWRDDIYAGAGWHIPGGIVRFKEHLEQRVRKVAEIEIGVPVKFDPVPIAMNQIICDHHVRGHHISFLYKCFLSRHYIPDNSGLSYKDSGFLMWHDSCPENLVNVQDVYKKYI